MRCFKWNMDLFRIYGEEEDQTFTTRIGHAAFRKTAGGRNRKYKR